jgi:hypothetical protein
MREYNYVGKVIHVKNQENVKMNYSIGHKINLSKNILVREKFSKIRVKLKEEKKTLPTLIHLPQQAFRV